MGEEDPEVYPLIIFCEGGTTNGSQLIKFKRGAFMACGSIWPKIIKYDCDYITPNSGISEGFAYYTIVGAAPWATPRRIELPIFRPNDFFWKNHVREGEQKWECYRRVM